MEVLDQITNYARQYEGIEEIPNNSGWEHDDFQRMMENVGWEMGQAWCMWYAKLVWYEVYKQVEPEIAELLMNTFTGSATQSYANAENSVRLNTVVEHPVPGSIVIWRKWHNGEPDWRGHAGLIIVSGGGYIGSNFKSSEGNTNEQSGRLGRVIATKDRRNNHGETDGLVVEGFILPPVAFSKIKPEMLTL